METVITKLSETLDALGVVRVNQEWRACCPRCQPDETDPAEFKLVVNPGGTRPLVFFCFGCDPREHQAKRVFFCAVSEARGLDRDFLATPMEPGLIRRLWAELDDRDQLDRPPTADVDSLNAVYRFLLDQLDLRSEHRRWLQKRNFDPAVAEALGYRSDPAEPDRTAAALWAEFGPLLRGVPGFLTTDHSAQFLTRRKAVLTPCRDYQGRIVALKWRLLDGKGVRMRLLSSGKAGPKSLSVAHCPLGVGAARWKRVWLTEGERKADWFWQFREQPVLGAPGAGQWRSLLGPLSAICEPGGEVVLALDRDATGIRNEPLLGAALHQSGYQVLRGNWDGLKLDEGTDFTVAPWERVFERTSGSPQHNKQAGIKTTAKGTVYLLSDEDEIVNYVETHGPLLRDAIPTYQKIVSRLIANGRLRIKEKTPKGQVISLCPAPSEIRSS